MGKTTPAKKNPVGRPEVYTYTDQWNTWIEEWKIQVIKGEQLPSLERLTLYLQDKIKEECEKHICINTVRIYAQEENNKPEFMEALSWIMLNQRIELIEKGLKGEYNSTIAKLVLSANHGMHEKTEQDQTHNITKMPLIEIDGKPMEFNIGD